jgi:hypothetical protein
MYPSILASSAVPLNPGKYQPEITGSFQTRQQLLLHRFVKLRLYIVKSFSFSKTSIITNIPVRIDTTTVYPREFVASEALNCIVMWGFELQLAVKLGLEKISYSGIISYEGADLVFKDYMLFFFNLKDKNKDNPSKKMTAKLLMNSLYGKMGQLSDENMTLVPFEQLQNADDESLNKPTSAEQKILHQLGEAGFSGLEQ